MSLFDAINAAGSGMFAQSVRLNTTASNLANIDTTSATEKDTYHAKMPVFKSIVLNHENATQGVDVLKISESKAPVERFYQPGNPQADKDGYVYGSNVNRIEALTNMISASQSYQADTQIANTCKDLLMNTVAMIKG